MVYQLELNTPINKLIKSAKNNDMQVVFENLHIIKYSNVNQTIKLYLNLLVIQNTDIPHVCLILRERILLKT